MVRRRGPRLTAAQKAEVWCRWRQGESLKVAPAQAGSSMKRRPTDQELSALADSVTRALKRDARNTRTDDGDAAPPVDTRERVRIALKKRKFVLALEAVASPVGSAHWLLLERAFRFMTETDGAVCLRNLWLDPKPMHEMPKVRLLRLFREASLLRKKVEVALPERVRVYRGACKASWRQARRSARNGPSWTTDLDRAADFAKDDVFALQRSLHNNQPPPSDTAAVGCIATATVPRDAILAYFHGEGFGVYHENECVLDPSAIEAYERVNVPKQPQN